MLSCLESTMLELLNPTALDIVRFATQTLRFRQKLTSLYSKDPDAAFELAADQFLSPPQAARRKPDIERLREDSKRFFNWSGKEWKQLLPTLQTLIGDMKGFTVDHRNEKVQCYQWKPIGKKTSGRMLLCHGWEGYALNFAALITQARAEGWEVIAFDHLAHGNSGGKHSGTPIALSTLLAVADHVGKLDVIIGHSLGASAVAWAMAHKKTSANRAVLLAPFFDTLHLTRMWAKAHFLNEEIRAGMQAALEKTTPLRFESFMPDGLAPLISSPILIVHDPKDPVTAYKHSQALASLNKKIKLQPAKNTGHVRLLADPAYIVQALAFCDKAAA
jgi:pimeloyl-ACP methyl ester carboxylesterase